MFILSCAFVILCQGYNAVRERFGLKKAKTFDDLVELSANVTYQLQQLYEFVHLIYVG